jgi:hypothetical protein
MMPPHLRRGCDGEGKASPLKKYLLSLKKVTMAKPFVKAVRRKPALKVGPHFLNPKLPMG